MTEIDTYNYTFYTFICNDPNVTDTYVGSTKSFRARKSTHKCQCNNEHANRYHLKIYQIIRDNGGWDNWEMKPIDTKKCTKMEARIHETKLMQELQSSMNMRKPYLTEEQLKELTKNSIANWRVNNKDKINTYAKEYYQKNKNKQSDYYKIYNANNKDKINARRKELRDAKKEANMINEEANNIIEPI